MIYNGESKKAVSSAEPRKLSRGWGGGGKDATHLLHERRGLHGVRLDSILSSEVLSGPVNGRRRKKPNG
jgi:hypothetical protein